MTASSAEKPRAHDQGYRFRSTAEAVLAGAWSRGAPVGACEGQYRPLRAAEAARVESAFAPRETGESFPFGQGLPGPAATPLRSPASPTRPRTPPATSSATTRTACAPTSTRGTRCCGSTSGRVAIRLDKTGSFFCLSRFSRIAEYLPLHEPASPCAAPLRQRHGAAGPGRRLTSARRLVAEAFVTAVGTIAVVWAGWVLLGVTEQCW
jgi:hypothetical protein